MNDSLLGITALNWILAVIGIVTAASGAWLYFRPGIRRARAVADAILGEQAQLDRNNNVITPGQPGLVHRVTSVELAIGEFRHMVGLLTEVQGRLDRHEERLHAIELSSVERIVTKAESAEMWRAVADTASPDVPDLD